MGHGAALRVLSKHPCIADQISADYHHAELTPRQRAMLDFAVKVTLGSAAIEAADFGALRAHGFSLHVPVVHVPVDGGGVPA